MAGTTMKPTLTLLTALLLAPLAALHAVEFHVAAVGDWPVERTVCRPIPLGDVKLEGFLGSHVDANNHASIPAGIKSAIPAAFEAGGPEGTASMRDLRPVNWLRKFADVRSA
jgi:hypothetical protein